MSPILYDGVGVSLVSDCRAMRESPQINIDNQFLANRVETQMTNQRQCDHGRWPEANVGQQYRSPQMLGNSLNLQKIVKMFESPRLSFV